MRDYLTAFLENIKIHADECKRRSVSPNAVKTGVKPVDYKVYVVVSGQLEWGFCIILVFLYVSLPVC